MNIAGLILAGGAGSRMGGVDKGLVPMGDAPMIAQVVKRFSPQVSRLAINANRSIDDYARFGFPVIQDALTGFAGPLAGLAAGFSHAKLLNGDQVSHLATVPCDSPKLPLDLVARLEVALTTAHAEIAVAHTDDGAQPVFALYALTLAQSLEQFLSTGRRKIDAWTAQHRVIAVPFTDRDAFANINTPEELRRLT